MIFVLLALALPARPAKADGVVAVCDESSLTAAIAGGAINGESGAPGGKAMQGTRITFALSGESD
jgi:hypothetical protein